MPELKRVVEAYAKLRVSDLFRPRSRVNQRTKRRTTGFPAALLEELTVDDNGQLLLPSGEPALRLRFAVRRRAWQQIPLLVSPCNYGGLQLWLQCKCGRRCSVLYAPSWDHRSRLACRQCHRLLYASQINLTRRLTGLSTQLMDSLSRRVSASSLRAEDPWTGRDEVERLLADAPVMAEALAISDPLPARMVDLLARVELDVAAPQLRELFNPTATAAADRSVDELEMLQSDARVREWERERVLIVARNAVMHLLGSHATGRKNERRLNKTVNLVARLVWLHRGEPGHRKMLELREQGSSYREIAERLNEDRFRTLDGKSWTTYRVTRFLSDPG